MRQVEATRKKSGEGVLENILAGIVIPLNRIASDYGDEFGVRVRPKSAGEQAPVTIRFGDIDKAYETVGGKRKLGTITWYWKVTDNGQGLGEFRLFQLGGNHYNLYNLLFLDKDEIGVEWAYARDAILEDVVGRVAASVTASEEEGNSVSGVAKSFLLGLQSGENSVKSLAENPLAPKVLQTIYLAVRATAAAVGTLQPDIRLLGRRVEELALLNMTRYRQEPKQPPQ